MHYLRKYVGKYRVKAEYDLSTNDFPRDEDGLDPSFDDLYIDCKNGIKIKHGVSNVLSCYIPSKSRGINVLKQIYTNYISDDLPNETSSTQKYYNNLCDKLVETKTLVSAEVLDFEVYFEFKSNITDDIAKIVGAKTSGNSISPFSIKNLPKTPYSIPNSDLKMYTKAVEHFPTKTIKVKGKERTMVDGLAIKAANALFDEIIAVEMPKGVSVIEDKRLKGLKGKDYIHSFGPEMWQKYCEFLEQYEDF